MTKKIPLKKESVTLCTKCGSSNKKSSAMLWGGLITGGLGASKQVYADCGFEGIFIEVDIDQAEEVRKKIKKKDQ